MQPVWKEEILTFLVVKSIKTALVEVRDGDVLVGEFKLDLQGIIGSNKEENF